MNGLIGPISDHVVALSEIALRNPRQLPTVSTSVFPANYGSGLLGIFACAVDSHSSKVFVYGTNFAGAPQFGWTRSAGTDWTPATSMPGATTALRGMAASLSTLVLVGDISHQALYSTDQGATWSAVSAHGAFDYFDVCYSNGSFYAICSGSSSQVGKSAGNVNYVATAADPSAVSLGGIRAGQVGASQAVLVWTTGGGTSVSTDGGATWAHSVGGVFSADIPRDIRYCASQGIWMAVSGKLEFATSQDGVTWTSVSAPLGFSVSPSLATDGGGAWVVVYGSASNQTRYAYSTNGGVTWKQILLRDVPCWTPKICYSPLEDCFYLYSKAVSTTDEIKVYKTFSTGTNWASLG
jgi:hypothetical protein